MPAASPLDPVDELLRQFARALIETAIHVHKQMDADKVTALTPKSQRPQGKSPAPATLNAHRHVVSCESDKDSGAAPQQRPTPWSQPHTKVET
jgi:hypothetical protein